MRHLQDLMLSSPLVLYDCIWLILLLNLILLISMVKTRNGIELWNSLDIIKLLMWCAWIHSICYKENKRKTTVG